MITDNKMINSCKSVISVLSVFYEDWDFIDCFQGRNTPRNFFRFRII